MTSITEFNQVDDCDKISADCINAFVDFHLDPDNPAGVCLETSWGSACLDLTSVVKAAETCTSLYLSPDEEPNCLVYEGECDNYCIHGDDLSRIISMTKLKDVDQETAPTNGDVYIYRDGKFYPFNLQQFVDNTNTAIQNIEGSINSILAKLTPPAGSPDNVRVMFGNINLYSDPNVVISEGSGSVTTLDKTHGIYGHALAQNWFADEIFG